VLPGLPGVWSALAEAPVAGYEIHAGRTRGWCGQPLIRLEAGSTEGVVARDGCVAGTYLHGVLERPEPRRALLAALAARRGFVWQPRSGPAPDPFDRLADVLESSLRLDALRLPAASMLRA
jgi:adenosylcobyric acid synthase